MQEQDAVRDNPDESRFEATVDGQLAIAEYVRQGDTIIFTHTFVPEALRGQGVGDQLARHALDQAREQGLKVVPQCPTTVSTNRWWIRTRANADERGRMRTKNCSIRVHPPLSTPSATTTLLGLLLARAASPTPPPWLPLRLPSPQPPPRPA